MRKWPFLALAIVGYSAIGQNQVNPASLNNIDNFAEIVTVRSDEKAYAISDKPYYILGDTLWFQCFLVDVTSHSFNAVSNTLYVELLDVNGDLKSQKIIFIEEGSGNGDFTIDTKWKEGSYTLRAYTRWMFDNSEKFLLQF